MTISVRFYAELVELSRRRCLEVPDGPPRAVKDVIASLGVPPVEVALILVDGTPVGFGHQVTGGHRVAVYPPWRTLPLSGVPTVLPPPIAPRFVLDVHLGTLTRRLRYLGIDCRYHPDVDDAELARIAVDDERILLSRDRGLLMRRVVRHGYCPRSDDPDEQAVEVVRRYGLVAHLAVSTRCVRCNGQLEAVELAAVAESVPPRSRAAFDRFARCTDCGRVVWPGSHTEALAPFLARIRALSAVGSDAEVTLDRARTAVHAEDRGIDEVRSAAMTANAVHDLLNEHHVDYETHTHDWAVTAQRVAAAEDVTGWDVAKPVLVSVGGQLAMVVVPAPITVDLDRLSQVLGDNEVRLASEVEFVSVFPDCEPGAEPPFGGLYGVPVFLDERLRARERLVCRDGSHTQTIALTVNDYVRVVGPEIIDVATGAG